MPKSLIANHFHATPEDIYKARMLMYGIHKKHVEKYGLNDDNLAIVPNGVRYFSVYLPNGLGDLQITGLDDKYSIIAYQRTRTLKIPELMVFNINKEQINEALDFL